MAFKIGIWLFAFASILVADAAVARGQVRGRQTDEPPLASDAALPIRNTLPPQNLPPLGPETMPVPMYDPAVRPVQNVVPMPPTIGSEIAPPFASGIAAPGIVLPEPPTPYVTLMVRGPANAASASDITYRIIVRNPSQGTARNVLVKALIPKNAKYLRSTPVANASSEAQWEWQIGNLEAGAIKEIGLIVQPGDAAAIDVVARVSFEFGQWVQTRISPPALKIRQTGAERGIVQDSLSYRIELTNTGKVPITGITVEVALTKEMQRFDADSSGESTSSPEKGTRMWQIGTLAAGQTRAISYKATALSPGDSRSKTIVLGNGIKEAADFVTKIVEPKLSLSVNGPDKTSALVGQPATYRVTVENKGDAPLANVRVQLSHPTDMRVRNARNGGQYFADSTAQWLIPKLDPGQSRQINVGLQAQTIGLKKVIVTARGDRGPEAIQEVTNDYQGLASLTWGDFEGPSQIAAGDKFDYMVKVNNPGSGAAKDFRLEVILPAGIRFEGSDTGGQFRDGRVIFHPKNNRIDPRTALGFSFKASSAPEASGQKRIRFVMIAKQLDSEVVADRSLTILGSASSGLGQVGSTDAPTKPPRPDAPATSTAGNVVVPAIAAIPTSNEKKPPMPPEGGLLKLDPLPVPMPTTPVPMDLPKIDLPKIDLPMP